MIVGVCDKYAAPMTERAILVGEGSFCASKPVKIQSKVEVDDWVTVENDVTFD